MVLNTKGIDYYYLGWHVERSKKMAYKPKLRPSELLCPYTHTYVYYDDIKHRFENEKDLRLNFEAPIISPIYPIDDIVCFALGNYYRFGFIKDFLEEYQKEKLQIQLESFLEKFPNQYLYQIVFVPRI